MKKSVSWNKCFGSNVLKIGILIICVMLFLVLNIVIDKVNENKYGDYSGNSEYLETIDLCDFFDQNGEGEYLLSFDLRTDVCGDVLVELYSSLGSKYWMNDCHITSTEKMVHYEIPINVYVVFNDANVAPLIFHGGYGTGAIPHVKNIEIEPIN